LREYQAVLRTDPNRFRSLLGLARAAKLANDAPTADDSYRQLVALSMKADTERPEVVEARQYLAH